MVDPDIPLPDLTDEAQYRLLSDNPGDIVYRCGPDLHLVWVSESITSVLGWTPAEVIGTAISDLTHPEDRASNQDQADTVRSGIHVPELSTGTVPPVRVRARDGSYRWVSAIGIPLMSADGTAVGVVGRLRDVDAAERSVRALEHSEERRRTAFDHLLDPLLVMEPVRDEAGEIIDFEYVEVNEAACLYNTMPYEQMIGARLLDLQPGNRDSGSFAEIVAVFETGVPLIVDNYPYEQELMGGERRYYDLRVARAADVLIYTWRDGTDRRLAEEAVAEREDLYRLVTDEVTDAVVRFDDEGLVTWVSPSFERLTGFSSDAVIGQSGMRLLPPPEVPSARDLLTRRVSGEDTGPTTLQMVCADGSHRWVEATSRPFIRHDGTPGGFVAVLRDVQEQVDAQLRHEHETGHDALTGLANRDLAIARLNRALDDIGNSRGLIALLSVGVDRLTTVNQAMNYAAGDRVLSTVAARLAAAVGDPDRVARVAGDEFAILLPGLVSVADAAAKAEWLCAAARGTITIDAQVIEPTVSIGVAIGDRTSTSEELLRKASLAVQQAKAAGRDRWQFVDAELALDAQRRLRLETQLRDGVREGRIVPWYQPIVTLSDRHVHGYEALARWVPQDGETMLPQDFLSVAESTGLIVDIDLAVLTHALDLLRVTPIEHVAVNVSPPTLAVNEYPDRFHDLLTSSGVDPTRLRLEVTETALLDVAPAIAEAMRSMASTGATWYVDDFGTGFSSISHLRDLPVRGLKLDQSFTAGIRKGDGTCIKLAQGLIGLAEGLGLDTVAEGVETEFEAGALLGQGWRQGQGWLFGRPAATVPVSPPGSAG
ncbi:MAG: EAL domain-containing protein [Actinobacteria bacterium]|jgi:diguanylate cyclase (GGDEF)-like protein/PAS domain S-box-containing protein|nr:EAL domain-containing protein [Actinomycetota bacterium]